jgi:hypothetical protein
MLINGNFILLVRRRKNKTNSERNVSNALNRILFLLKFRLFSRNGRSMGMAGAALAFSASNSSFWRAAKLA